MTARRRTTLATVFAVMLSLAYAPVRADRGHNDGGEGLTAEQAAALVKRQYDGRVVSVKQEGNDNGQRSYKVRVLLDGGRVKTVQVDSRGNVREAN